MGAFDKSKLLLNFCRNFEDPSDIIEDVVEISVENSVEVNLLPVNNNSEVSADLINNSEENNEVPTVTDFR